jgi:hypothetical protein
MPGLLRVDLSRAFPPRLEKAGISAGERVNPSPSWPLGKNLSRLTLIGESRRTGEREPIGSSGWAPISYGKDKNEILLESLLIPKVEVVLKKFEGRSMKGSNPR